MGSNSPPGFKKFHQARRTWVHKETAVEFDERWRGRVLRATREGNISRAASALLQESKLPEVTPYVIEALQNLHPQTNKTQLPPNHPQDPELEVETDDILAAMKTFQRYSAPRPSGLRAAHISEAPACVEAGQASRLEHALTMSAEVSHLRLRHFLLQRGLLQVEECAPSQSERSFDD